MPRCVVWPRVINKPLTEAPRGLMPDPSFPPPPDELKIPTRRKKGKRPTLPSPLEREPKKLPVPEPHKRRRTKNPSIMNAMHQAKAKNKRRIRRLWHIPLRYRSRTTST